METISIAKFKSTCTAQLDKVKKSGRPLLITRRGKPVALIEPPPLPEKPAFWLGRFRDTGKIKGDIFSPVIDENQWDVLNCG